jgi:hypothetical protein
VLPLLAVIAFTHEIRIRSAILASASAAAVATEAAKAVSLLLRRAVALRLAMAPRMKKPGAVPAAQAGLPDLGTSQKRIDLM